MKVKHILSVILIMSALVSCSIFNGISDMSSTGINGLVSINLDIAQAMEAGFNITGVNVSLTHLATDTTINRELAVDSENKRAIGLISGLRTGLWEILVELYESDFLVGAGIATIEVIANQTSYIIINIDLVGTGNIQVAVTWGTETTHGPEIVVSSPIQNSVYVRPTFTVEGTVLDFQGDSAYDIVSFTYSISALALKESIEFDAQTGAFSFTVDVNDFSGNILILLEAEDVYSLTTTVSLMLLSG